jgi:hypothetical protein
MSAWSLGKCRRRRCGGRSRGCRAVARAEKTCINALETRLRSLALEASRCYRALGGKRRKASRPGQVGHRQRRHDVPRVADDEDDDDRGERDGGESDEPRRPYPPHKSTRFTTAPSSRDGSSRRVGPAAQFASGPVPATGSASPGARAVRSCGAGARFPCSRPHPWSAAPSLSRLYVRGRRRGRRCRTHPDRRDGTKQDRTIAAEDERERPPSARSSSLKRPRPARPGARPAGRARARRSAPLGPRRGRQRRPVRARRRASGCPRGCRSG